jgi:hypothetical protein
MNTTLPGFRTSDLALSAFLFASGTSLINVDRSDLQRVVFVFDPPKPELLSDWQSGDATVKALAYFRALRELKAKLYGWEER